jgi:hypothetical protein
MNRHRSDAIPVALGGLLMLAAAAAHAHEGHDHDEPSPPAAAVAGGPRFALATELFEVVGALDGRRLTLWLDRSADNAPVTDASIDLQVDGRAIPLALRGDVFVGELEGPPPAGRLPVAVTVMAGSDADVLAGELVVETVSGATGTSPGAGPGGAVAPPAGLGGASVPLPASPAALAATIAAIAAAIAGLGGWFLGRRSGRRARGAAR